MRDDFEITTEHIDLIADTAVQAGALGARMTGGGFGGCVIALVPERRAEAVADAVRTRCPIRVTRPTITRTHAAAGAGPGSRGRCTAGRNPPIAGAAHGT